VRTPRTAGPTAASPPYAREPSAVARPGASRAITQRHPELVLLSKPPLFPAARHPEPPPRHCRRRPLLELAAGAHHRPATLVAYLGPSEAHTATCSPALRVHAAIHRAAAVTAAVRRQTSPPANCPPPLRCPATPR
jgi:hypothetical protein